MRKLLVILTVVGLFCFGGWKAFLFFKKERRGEIRESAPTVKVERRNLEKWIVSSGDLAPALSVEVKPEVSGRIKKIHVVVGQKVKKGDLLVELDDRDLLTDKTSAETEIEGARLSLEKNKRQFDRASRLYTSKLVSQEFYENAKTDQEIAQNNFEKAQSRLQTVMDRLDKTRIAAPMDGIILSLPVVEWQVVIGATSVNSGTLLMSIADLNSMLISIHVNQVDIVHVRNRQEVTFSVDAIQKKGMPGRVYLISPMAVSKNNVKGFTVQVEVSNPDPLLKPGMSADVSFSAGEAKNTLTLPLAAIFSDEKEGKVVYLKSVDGEQEAVRKEIETGLVTYDYAEIRSGVSEGDEVLLTLPPKGKKP